MILDNDSEEMVEVTAPVENRELVLQIAFFDIGITLKYSAHNIQGAACCIMGNIMPATGSSLSVELRTMDDHEDGAQLVSQWSLSPDDSPFEQTCMTMEQKLQSYLNTLLVI